MHLNAYLQPCPGFGWQGGPEFSTQIVELQSGRERRNARWDQARHRYSAPYNNISHEAYEEIKRMFMVCRGQLHAFRFRDELDFEADDELFAVGDGVLEEFQLAIISIVDNEPQYRYIFAPVDAIEIFVDGVAATATVDYMRGTVTFDTPPADGAVLTWSGLFDVWVRFTQDYLPSSIDNVKVVNTSVDLIETAPPAPVVP